jgi:hypothetical protein
MNILLSHTIKLLLLHNWSPRMFYPLCSTVYRWKVCPGEAHGEWQCVLGQARASRREKGQRVHRLTGYKWRWASWMTENTSVPRGKERDRDRDTCSHSSSARNTHINGWLCMTLIGAHEMHGWMHPRNLFGWSPGYPTLIPSTITLVARLYSTHTQPKFLLIM